MTISLEIPLKNHIYKYIQSRYGDDYILSKNDFIGKIILSSLNKKTQTISKLTNKMEGHKFRFKITDSYFMRSGIFISEEQYKLVNDILDHKFRDELYSYAIIQKKRHNEDYLKSMKYYCNLYNILDEDDIKIETLYRDFTRKLPDFKRFLTQ